jgi:SulP family sulfate permease
MANGVLVGVHPVYGLYAAMMGPAVGGLSSSTQLMMITTTAAASLSASQALGGVEGADRLGALTVMVILVGVFQVVFGLLRFGRLIRFVSYSVTTGFLSGVSVMLVLNQLPVVTGLEPGGGGVIARTAELGANLSRVDRPSLALSGLAFLLAVVLPKTPLRNLGRLLAIIVPSVLVALLGLSGVELVRDAGEIPKGLPEIVLPSLVYVTPQLVTGALAVAVVILVQGAGVSQSVPNPDGSRRSTSRDFFAQGLANLASGLLRGLPVGGSLSASALNVIYGAHSRWAAVFAGVCIALILLAFSGPVSAIAMPALGALLILAGLSSLKPQDIRAVWVAGWPSRLAAVGTFLAAVLFSVPAAVGLGVLLSAILAVTRASTDVTLVQLSRRSDGRIKEGEPPKRLASGEVTVLDVYGPLFYAGARTLERMLPTAEGSRRPAVVLRLRGLRTPGATLLDVLTRYAGKLKAADGRLYIAGVPTSARDHLAGAGRLTADEAARIYEAEPVRGLATDQAVADARAWLGTPRSGQDGDDRQTAGRG